MRGEGEKSLKKLFEAGEQLRVRLESLHASSEQYQSSLQEVISKYEQCRELAANVSLFSPNEAADDIGTSDLRYLSIDFIIGELLSRNFAGQRPQLLQQSQSAYAQYLSHMQDYDLLSKEQKSLYERFLEDKDSFSVLPLNNASARRNVKIARFQQEKEIKQKIEYLNSDPRIREEDEATIRDLRLAELSLNTHQTFQSLDMISQEMKMLSQAPLPPPTSQTSSEDHRQAKGTPIEGYSERLDIGLSSMLQNGKSGPLLSKSGRPLQPFTLLDSRERLRNGVFKPGHNLPTMTIDEYLEEERKRGGIIEGGGEPPVVEPNEDDMEAADRETMKAREWDEFVEANPKGSGNTLNRG